MFHIPLFKFQLLARATSMEPFKPGQIEKWDEWESSWKTNSNLKAICNDDSGNYTVLLPVLFRIKAINDNE